MGRAAEAFAGLFRGLTRGTQTMIPVLFQKQQARARREETAGIRTEAGQMRATERAEEQSLREEGREEEQEFRKMMLRKGHQFRVKEAQAGAARKAAGKDFSDILRDPALLPTLKRNPGMARLAVGGDTSAVKSLLDEAKTDNEYRARAMESAATEFGPQIQAELPPEPPPLPEFHKFKPKPSISKEQFMEFNIREARPTRFQEFFGQRGKKTVLSKKELERKYTREVEVERALAYKTLKAQHAQQVGNREAAEARKLQAAEGMKARAGELYTDYRRRGLPEDQKAEKVTLTPEQKAEGKFREQQRFGELFKAQKEGREPAPVSSAAQNAAALAAKVRQMPNQERVAMIRRLGAQRAAGGAEAAAILSELGM